MNDEEDYEINTPALTEYYCPYCMKKSHIPPIAESGLEKLFDCFSVNYFLKPWEEIAICDDCFDSYRRWVLSRQYPEEAPKEKKLIVFIKE